MMIADYEVYLKLKELFPTENIYNFPVSDNEYIQDRAIFVNQYGERTPDRVFSSRKETEYPVIQIFVRGEINNPKSAKDLSNEIRKKIQSISWTSSVGIEIEDCKMTSGIFPLGKDSKNRYQYSINIELNYYINLES